MPSSSMSDIPIVPKGATIPRIIHQAFPTKNLPAPMRALVDELRANNPTWEHRLYDHDDIREFILVQYGPKMLEAFLRIDERYGAARIDFWRYLLIYKLGGVYIDIKSTFTKPLDEVIQPDDEYILSSWNQSAGAEFSGYGIHPKLSHRETGEFQQWHVIAVKGHPFLRAVAERVLDSIEHYNPWRDGAGKVAVLNVTGPVPYTLAIEPLLARYPHRLVADESHLSLIYNALGGVTYQQYLPPHYSLQKMPLIDQGLVGQAAFTFYLMAKQGYLTARNFARRIVKR